MRAIRLSPAERATPDDGWLRFFMPPGFVTCATILGLRAGEIDAIRVRSRALELVNFETFTSEGECYTGGEAAQLLWDLTHPPAELRGPVSVDLADSGAGVQVTFKGEAWLMLRLTPGAVPAGAFSVAFQLR